MKAYHGTTRRRAQRIAREGFLPRKPSRRVWFAAGRRYALGRARAQARRSHDRPVVLACDRDLNQLRRRLGKKRVRVTNGIIAIDGVVPVTVLRSNPTVDLPTAPRELATWVNHVLGLKPHKGVGRNHPGIGRLSRWLAHRMESEPDRRIRPSELLHLARQWLGEYFQGVEVDDEHLCARVKVGTIHVQAVEPEAEPDAREQEALDLLDDGNPKRRARGLKLLVAMENPDLLDWCLMYLLDESVDVQVAALDTMCSCEYGDPDAIVPLAGSEDKRIRAAAVAVLARHSGHYAPLWFEYGLTDPSTCVRLKTAWLLGRLDPVEHRRCSNWPCTTRTRRSPAARKSSQRAKDIPRPHPDEHDSSFCGGRRGFCQREEACYRPEKRVDWQQMRAMRPSPGAERWNCSSRRCRGAISR